MGFVSLIFLGQVARKPRIVRIVSWEKKTMRDKKTMRNIAAEWLTLLLASGVLVSCGGQKKLNDGGTDAPPSSDSQVHDVSVARETAQPALDTIREVGAVDLHLADGLFSGEGGQYTFFSVLHPDGPALTASFSSYTCSS